MRTRTELADALDKLKWVTYGDMPMIREAATALRKLEGERRIEGVIIEEDMNMGGVHRIVIHQRDRDMADPYGYARATVIIQAPEEKDDES